MYPLTRPGCAAKSASVNGSTSAGATPASSRFRSTSRSPGTPTRAARACRPGATSTSDTFFSVSAAVQGRSGAGEVLVGEVDERVDRRGVGGVLDVRGRGASNGTRSGHGSRDGLDVGGVVAGRAADEGVLAVRGGARNSSLADPPIAPDIAETMTYSRPRRSKVCM